MSAPQQRFRASPELGRRARRPQLEREVPVVPIAVARHVIEEASRWLGVPLSGRYATRLSFCAQRCYAHSESFREKIRRPGYTGRDRLYLYMRHWLAARLHAEQPALHACLPKDYSCGAPLPPPPPPPADEALLAGRHATGEHLPSARHPLANCPELSLDARWLAFG